MEKCVGRRDKCDRRQDKEEDSKRLSLSKGMTNKRGKDIFNGLSESELLSRRVPDYLADDLDIVFIGINPGLTSAYKGHHYAHVGNHFWKCLYDSGLINEPMNAYDDYKLIKYGIGFTNIVNRTTRTMSQLSREEIRCGGETLKRKLQNYQPKIAVFNGKGIYEIFCGTNKFNLGLQQNTIGGTQTKIFVMPSSSPRCQLLPRASDKLPYYQGLKKLLDHLRDKPFEPINESEFVYPQLKFPGPTKSSQSPPADGVCAVLE